MDKYNLEGLATFLVKHEFIGYAVISDCVLVQKRDDKKWHYYWGKPAGETQYNKTRTQTTIWRKIVESDPEYGKMSARQKVELVDMIIRKLEVA